MTSRILPRELSSKERLREIVHFCHRIEELTTKDYHNFILLSFFLLQIGEHAGRLLVKYKFDEQYPHVRWKEWYGLRNLIVHNFANVEADLLWFTAKNDVPLMLMACQQLWEELV